MKISCPYSEFDLRCEVIGLEKRIEEHAKEIEELIKATPQTKQELNAKAAADNGITVEQLLNSINYEILMNEARQSAAVDLIVKFRELGFDDKEAWAFLAIGTGSLRGDV